MYFFVIYLAWTVPFGVEVASSEMAAAAVGRLARPFPLARRNITTCLRLVGIGVPPLRAAAVVAGRRGRRRRTRLLERGEVYLRAVQTVVVVSVGHRNDKLAFDSIYRYIKK